MRLHIIAAVLALALTGCGSGLQVPIDVVNAISAGAISAGSKINEDFSAAEKACLSVAPDLPTQRKCLDATEAKYMPTLTAFDDLYAALTLAVAIIRTEEARGKAGGAPSLAQVTMLVPELLMLAGRFNERLAALRSPVATPKGTP